MTRIQAAEYGIHRVNTTGLFVPVPFCGTSPSLGDVTDATILSVVVTVPKVVGGTNAPVTPPENEVP